jgi:hypothetical protein
MEKINTKLKKIWVESIHFYVFFTAFGYQLSMSVVRFDCRLYVAVGIGCLQLVVGCREC